MLWAHGGGSASGHGASPAHELLPVIHPCTEEGGGVEDGKRVLIWSCNQPRESPHHAVHSHIVPIVIQSPSAAWQARAPPK